MELNLVKKIICKGGKLVDSITHITLNELQEIVDTIARVNTKNRE